MATLTGSDGFSTSASADVALSVNTIASLTIDKTIPNILQGSETATFVFHVKSTNDASAADVASTSISFGAGDTEKTALVSNLTPGVYYVFEDTAPGFQPQGSFKVDVSGAACSGTATFHNTAVSAHAQVTKVTNPSGFEANWTFELKDSGGNVLETETTTGAGSAKFTTDLGEGSYTIVEESQNGWSSDGGSAACSFTVDLPADADRTFSCTYTNTYQPSVHLTKTGSPLSKIGDGVSYVIALQNTSSPGEAAGAPSLACHISDTTIGFSKDVTLAAGATETSNPAFTIPSGAADPFPNTATASCTYPSSSAVVASSNDSWNVNLFQPSVKISKTGPTYSQVGDTVTYQVTIQNTSSSDSPNLILASFTDSKVSSATADPTCNTLAPGASCSFTYTYTVQASDDSGQIGAPLSNTATVLYHPDGFPNDITDSSTWNVSLLHPSFTVTKTCTSQPVPQAGPATFQVTLKNTGDADLVISPNEGSGPYTVAAGKSTSFNVTVNGPFAGQATVDNTVKASATLDQKYGLSDALAAAQASASCTVEGLAQVKKTVSGAAASGTQSFTFQLRQGASTTSAGTILETGTANAGNGGVINFATNLDPSQTYQLCEIVMPGWSTNLGTVVSNTFSPPDDNSVLCGNFGRGTTVPVNPGQTLTFTVDNTPPPGGRALTFGFWKNWASCASSKGKQQPVLDQTLAKAEPTGIVVSAGSGSYPGFGPALYLVLHGSTTTPNAAPDCTKTVNLLNKTPIDGTKKMASDPAFNLAAQLVAAELNYTAGAGKTPAATSAINQAVLLLGKYQFNGLTHTTISSADATTMNRLATTLDNYNNDR